MFTGIVQGIASIAAIERASDIVTLIVRFPKGALSGSACGASIAIDGCCLTVKEIRGDTASFDCTPETVRRSRFDALVCDEDVNFERPLRSGDEVGGHILSGHVDAVAEVVRVENLGHSKIAVFCVDSTVIKYIFSKGYVALNGASLTICEVNSTRGEFSVSLIPETLAKTTFGAIAEGARVNIEIDRTTQAIVDTVERVMCDRGLR